MASSFVRELEFRANFIAKIFQNLMWLGFFVVILLVIYGNAKSMAGWSEAQVFVLAATVFMMNAASSALFFSLQEVPLQIRQGTMDFVVTKPVDSQFWVSLRRFNFDQIGAFLVGAGMLTYGIVTSHLHPSLLQWTAWAVLSISSLALFYGFTLLIVTLAVWLIRVDNLFILTETTVQLARNPMDIYGARVQRFLTFGVPLVFISTVPARQLTLGVNLPMVGLGVLWAVIALTVSRSFWHFAMGHYTSASS